MIPKEVLMKYNMLTIEGYKEVFGDRDFTEENFYQTFLTQTDHVTSEILEQLIQDLSEATVGEFAEAYLRFMANVKVNYADILRYRRMAREEIKKLEEERTLTEVEDTDRNI